MEMRKSGQIVFATETLIVATKLDILPQTIADKPATEGIALEASTPLNLRRMLHLLFPAHHHSAHIPSL
jgi:hypothetical protein